MLRSLLVVSSLCLTTAAVANPDVLRPHELQQVDSTGSTSISKRPLKKNGIKTDYSPSRVISISKQYENTTRWRNKRLWCAEYVNHVLTEAGIPGTKSRLGRDFLRWGHDVTRNPRPGDVVVLSRKGGSHVGFFMGYSGNKVVIHSGNTSSRDVRGRTVSAGLYSTGRIVGIRRAHSQVAGL